MHAIQGSLTFELHYYFQKIFNFTENAISSKDYVDSLGRRIYQSVNVDGNRSFGSYLSYNFKLKKLSLLTVAHVIMLKMSPIT